MILVFQQFSLKPCLPNEMHFVFLFHRSVPCLSKRSGDPATGVEAKFTPPVEDAAARCPAVPR